jgi:hypothetical protein
MQARLEKVPGKFGHKPKSPFLEELGTGLEFDCESLCKVEALH